ncbi:MAG: methylated-DNA--[protein]-cysteine S-methyltransferase [Deltaproteobacteria bacterium]|nr:methylated-DNA--[protein]-cysteine S-methyltransferase [Deltaproteobacteria bacterium]
MAGASLQKIYCGSMKLDRLYIHMASTEKGALRVGLSLRSKPDATGFFKRLYPNSEWVEDHDANQPLQQAIEAVLSNQGHQSEMDLAELDLDVDCAPFQWSVMKTIAKIPFGETKTYKEVAAMAGSPKGARAVGQAMGRNPLPLIFP